MATFKDSGESTDIFQSRDGLMNEAELEKYSTQFGEERTIGYMEAMRDFNKAILVVLGPGYEYDGIPKPCPKIKKAVIDLYHTNSDLIDKFVSQNGSKAQPLI